MYAYAFEDRVFTSTMNFYLFTINNAGAPAINGMKPSRLYRARFYLDGVLILDLVPYRIDGNGYLLDLISGKFLENQGTGSFIIGPDL